METIGGLIILQSVEYQVGHHKFMTKPVWNDLHRTLDDQTTIEEAIDAAVGTHNDDPQAHLDVNQAVEAHRADNILDHPAESVWNDKINVPARRFVALVDPSIDDGFDTVRGAVDEAIAKGGGFIRVSSGTHLIDEAVHIPSGIYLYGSPDSSTVIDFDTAAGGGITLESKSDPNPFLYGFENISFIVDNGYQVTDGGGTGNTTLCRFRDCNFLGGGRFFEELPMKLSFDRCHFELSGNATMSVTDYGPEFFRCTSEIAPNETVAYLVRPTVYDEILTNLEIRECDFKGGAGESNNYLYRIDLVRARINDTDFDSARFYTCWFDQCLIVSNRIDLWSGTWLNINEDSNLISSNRFTGGSGDQLRLVDPFNFNVAIGNVLDTPIDDASLANLIVANIGDYSPATVSASSYPTVTQSLDASTWTQIIVDARDYDQGDNMSVNDFIAPCNGFYEAKGVVMFYPYNGRGIAEFQKNDVEFWRGLDIKASRVQSLPICCEVYLEKGDKFNLWGWRDSAGDTLNTGNNRFSRFQVSLKTRVGELLNNS